MHVVSRRIKGSSIEITIGLFETKAAAEEEVASRMTGSSDVFEYAIRPLSTFRAIG